MSQRIGKTCILFVTLTFGCLLAAASLSAWAKEAKENPRWVIPDHYFVLPHDQVNDPAAVAVEMTLVHGLTVRHVYREILNGFSAVVPPAPLRDLMADPR